MTRLPRICGIKPVRSPSAVAVLALLLAAMLPSARAFLLAVRRTAAASSVTATPRALGPAVGQAVSLQPRYASGAISRGMLVRCFAFAKGRPSLDDVER